MFGASPDIAGGNVTATLATNAIAPNTFGCKVTRTGTGVNQVQLPTPIPFDRLRVWVKTHNSGSSPDLNPYIVPVFSVAEGTIQIETFQLGVAAGPVFSQTPTNVAFSFGVSVIPE